LKKDIQVHDQIFQDRKVRKGLNDDGIGRIIPHELLTSKGANTVDTHPVGSAHPMSAGHTKGQGWILLPSDAIQTIQNPVCGLGIKPVFLESGCFIPPGLKSRDPEYSFHGKPKLLVGPEGEHKKYFCGDGKILLDQ
jgi:hypothetical protein